MKRSIHVLSVVFAGAHLATGTSVAVQNRRPALDAEARVEVVEQLAVLLGEQYVFADIGRNYATMLRRISKPVATKTSSTPSTDGRKTGESVAC